MTTATATRPATLTAEQLRVGDIVTEIGGEPIAPRMVIRAFGPIPGVGEGVELSSNGGVRHILYRADIERLNAGSAGWFTVTRRSRGHADPAKAAAIAGRQAGWNPNAGGGHISRPLDAAGPRSASQATRREEKRTGATEVYTGLQGWAAAAAWMRPRGWIVEIDGRWYATARSMSYVRPTAPDRPVEVSARMASARPVVLAAEGWERISSGNAAGCPGEGCALLGVWSHSLRTVGVTTPLCVKHAHRVQVYGHGRARMLGLV